MLVSAEADCCVGALSHLSMTDDTGRLFDEHGGRDKRACGSGEQGCEWDDVNGAKNYIGGMNMLAKVRTGTDPMYKYLNMGLFLGTEAEVLKFISVLDLGAREDDQAVATVLLHERPEMIALDYGAHIFGSQQRSEGNEEGCMYTKLDASGRLMHKFTGLVPFMIHNPGQNMMIAFEGPHAGTNMVPCQKEMLGKLDFGSYQDGYFPELNDHSHNNLN